MMVELLHMQIVSSVNYIDYSLSAFNAKIDGKTGAGREAVPLAYSISLTASTIFLVSIFFISQDPRTYNFILGICIMHCGQKGQIVWICDK